MAYDDEDPTAAPPPAIGQDDPSKVAIEDVEDAEADEAIPDFRKFASSFPGGGASGGGALNKKATPHVSAKTVRRGEKDFESHGTRLQENALETSRTAMHDVLSYTRTRTPDNFMTGWYFPEHWAQETSEGEKPEGLWRRDRVVVLEAEKGQMTKSMGRVLRGAPKNVPGWDKAWLLPEEALYLVERGDLMLRWPRGPIEDIFPPPEEVDGVKREVARGEYGDYELGLPLSLQAAYSLFIGNEGDRGKVTLEKFQVYSQLRRTGYLVSRASPLFDPPPPSDTQTLWQRLFSLISSPKSDTPKIHPPMGPLVKPGLYRSYESVYHQLSLIPRHKPTPTPNTPAPEGPFTVTYHVFKSRPGFTKTNLPLPDFRIAVVNARTTDVPDLAEMEALLDSTPWDPPNAKSGAGGPGIGHMYQRLKHGWRNVIVAVNDNGMVSYLEFMESAFGEEKLFERFDAKPRAGGKKSSGRNPRGGRGGGRGGRGGRGRGK